MGVRYGTSIAITDPRFGALTDDAAIIRQRARLALKTEQGSVRAFPEYGYDLEGAVNEGLSADDLARLPLEVRGALEQEPSFATVDVTLKSYAPLPAGGCAVELFINITPTDGDRVGFTLGAAPGAGITAG